MSETAPLRVGVMFPGDETGPLSRADIDTWTATITDAGYAGIVLGDHVVGIDAQGLPADVRADLQRRWPGPPGSQPYTHEAIFREPFVLGGYLAARCDLEIATSVLVLPQRQTALVAKQAAELDLLCEGRLRLGVGGGWNPVEYEALGARFADRGDRMAEQVQLLRRLWTEPAVSYHGRHHMLHATGIQMLPIQRPIPVWMGGEAPAVLDRIGRLADGWFPPVHVSPGERAATCLRTIGAAAEAAGRDPETIDIEPRAYTANLGIGLVDFVAAWQQHGATRICVDTRYGREPVSLVEHCARARTAAATLDLSAPDTTLPGATSR